MRKKRLCALAEWEFGGGASYCAACPPNEGCEKPCQDCPRQINRPLTLEGWQVWDLAQRMGGQLRVVPGAVIGWDLGAAMAMATALGVNPLVAAEFLPALEAVAVKVLNERVSANHEPGFRF